MLPALFGLFVAAACSLVERALCPIAQTWLARRMSAPLRFWSRSPPSHPSSLRSLSCLARLAPRRLRTLATPRNPPSRPSACDLRRARHACPAPRCRTAPELASLKTQNARPAPRCPRRTRTRHAARPAAHAASAMPRAPPPAAPRLAARVPLRFRQFPRNGAVIQLPIQENFVSKDKQ